jgi:hypothetical protein
MFSQYIVLFIGYSHDDTVMHYLSRGLPPGDTKPRFALIREDNDPNKWLYRGIKPLPYLYKGKKDHSQLSLAVAGWVEWANRGALDTERRIKDLVTAPPPLDEEAQDFLKWAVKDPVAVRFFTRHAKDPEWLLWSAEQKILEPLFLQSDLSEVTKELATWAAKNFVVQHADTFFSLLERYHNEFNPWFGYVIARSLAYGDSVPGGDIISRWVPILLQNKSFGDRFEFTRLLERSIKRERLAATAQLFEYLTRPHIRLKKHISWSTGESEKGPKADAELGFHGGYHLLSEAWEKSVKPKLSELAFRLWPVVIQNLNHAYQLLNSWGSTESTWDPMSWHRSAIEPDDQDAYPHTEDILINAARDCLEWALQNVPQVGLAWIESLSVLEPLILKRLAIHGVSFSSQMTANDKIDWLLHRDLLVEPGLKHELFQLLKNAYPGADPDRREDLLETAAKKIDALPGKDVEDKSWKEYMKFNLLHWLSLSAPDCQKVATRLALIKEAYPDFAPRKRLDLDHWSSGAGWVGPRSPVSVEELLKKRPKAWLEYFVTFKGENFEGPDRSGLLQNIGQAVQQDFDWGRELTDLLANQVGPTSDLWESLISGWNGANLIDKQWEFILSTLDDERLTAAHSRYISDLLEHGAKNEEGGISVDLLDKGDSVAQKVWANLQDEEGEEVDDWLGRAINYPSGRLTMFWLNALSRYRKETDQKDEGLLQPYRERFETIVSENSEAATLGRVVLVSQLGFLFAVDQGWTKENVVPLLDWDRDIQQAQQAWNGWLTWGHLTESLLNELIPFYKKSFSHVPSELQGERERFVEWIVVIALFWMGDPVENGWVTYFLQTVEEQDRINFASHAGSHLMSMKAETKIGLWERWLKKYWEGRNSGTPVPLANDELKEMIEWAGELEPVFPEAVAIICNGRVPQFKDIDLFWRLAQKENNIKNRYPEDLARLLVHLTTGAQMPIYFCGDLEDLTEGLITAGVSAEILRRLCENLATIGCAGAGDFSSKIK